MKPFILKSKQENWQRIVDMDLSDPKDITKSTLVGDDFALWERQNNYVNVLLRKLITTSASISILDNAKDDVSNAFDDFKIYHESSDIASARSVIILDELDQLRPKSSPSLGDFVSTFSAKVTEYDSIAPSPLGAEMNRMRLQRCIVGDERLVNTMSTLRIATIAAGKTKPSYQDYMLSLSEACNTIDATNISKAQIKSIPTRQVLTGEVNHYEQQEEFYDATDFDFDIQNAPTDTLQSFTTNLLAAHESVSKRRQKHNFNPEIDTSPLAFKELSNKGVKLWYQFDNKDRKIIVSMNDYPKEGSSATVPYNKNKLPNLNPRFRNDNRPSNRLSNSTDILDSGNEVMTRNDLE